MEMCKLSSMMSNHAPKVFNALLYNKQNVEELLGNQPKEGPEFCLGDIPHGAFTGHGF